MTDRIPVPVKLRFEIFKRDDFICQYCGKHPPEVILEVDHIYPVMLGGTNDPDNLATSCWECNRGKGAIELSTKARPLSERAAEIQERERQLDGYHEVMEAKRQRIEDQTWEVVFVFDPKATTFRRDWLRSIGMFIERLGYHEVLEASEIAMARKPYAAESTQFKYFCGICWKKLKDRENPNA